MPLDGLIINILLCLLQPVVENGPMFEMRGHLFSQIGEIRRIEGSVDDVILLAVIFVKCRIKSLRGDVAVLMGRNEIYLRK